MPARPNLLATSVLGYLAEHFSGEPDKTLRGAPGIAVIGQPSCFSLEMLLTGRFGAQGRTRAGGSQIRELADGAGEVPQHRGVVLAK